MPEEKKTEETKAKKTTRTRKPKEMSKDDIIAAIGGLPEEDKSAILLETVKGITVLGLSDFVKACEEAFGVSAAAPMMAVPAGMPAAAGAAGPAEEEKTEFDVILKEIGPKKIQVIKAVREITSLGLKESKELVDSAPTSVVQGFPKEEAEATKAKLEAEGAVVELK
ncbi:MAG: 50S ribosomal protein L7/L12 [Anaerolineales bacterium]|nr:MAG: 50S ribosomal protein L7/L12 [Anaerolineales bacterium]